MFTVPLSNPVIEFGIEGPGEIIATDNGNSFDMEAFSSNKRTAFSGLALVIVRPVKGEPGTIKVTAVSDGLSAGKITIKSE
jgi:beta-galactosidase